jgi:hypothetical protein
MIFPITKRTIVSEREEDITAERDSKVALSVQEYSKGSSISLQSMQISDPAYKSEKARLILYFTDDDGKRIQSPIGCFIALTLSRAKKVP